MKNCLRCETEKPLTDFWKHDGQPDGYCIWCKVCMVGTKREQELIERQKWRTDRKEGRTKEKFANRLKIEKQPERIKQIALAFIENPQASARDVAQITGLGIGTVLHAAATNPYLKALRFVATNQMTKMLPLAVQGMRDCLMSDNPKVKLLASIELLKNENVMGPAKIDVTLNDTRSRSIEELREIISQAQALPPPTFQDAEVIS